MSLETNERPPTVRTKAVVRTRARSACRSAAFGGRTMGTVATMDPDTSDTSPICTVGNALLKRVPISARSSVLNRATSVAFNDVSSPSKVARMRARES